MKPISTPQERLKIYEMVLDEISNDKTHWICMSIYLMVSDQMELLELPNVFIEFSKYHTCRGFSEGVIQYEELYEKDRKAWRIKVLTEIIENIKNS
jgi:hypothetical protein